MIIIDFGPDQTYVSMRKRNVSARRFFNAPKAYDCIGSD